MDKIASPKELSSELRTLLAYSESDKPSREKLAADLRALADRVAGTDKTASNSGYEILMGLLGGQDKFMDLQERIEREDSMCAELLVEVCSKISDKLNVDSGTDEAISRVLGSIRNMSAWKAPMHRNNIFKAANALGIRLPSGMF